MEKTKPKKLLNLWKYLHNKYSQPRAYIIPTWFGLVYALFAIVFIGIAYAFTNNAIYFLAFYMVALGLITMIFCSRNIDKLKLDDIKVEPIFAGEKGFIFVKISNDSDRSIYDLRIMAKSIKKANHSVEEIIVEKINARSTHEVPIPLEFKNRGYQGEMIIQIESRFPFKFFRSWKNFSLSKLVRGPGLIVYPARIGSLPLPHEYINSDNLNRDKSMTPTMDGFFAGHRAYQSFDSFRQIDWKAFARSQSLLVKQYELSNENNVFKICLNFEDTEKLIHFEDRISQLSQWISQCEKKSISYQLCLGSWASPYNYGDSHFRYCLMKLAMVEPNEI